MNTLQQEPKNIKKVITEYRKILAESTTFDEMATRTEKLTRESLATARAEGAAEERKKILTKIASCFPVEKEGDIGLFVVEHTGKLVPNMPFNDYEALTTKEHHAEE